MLTVDWTHRVNHVKRGQLAAGRNNRFAGRKSFRKTSAADLATFFQNLRAAGAMNRPVNSSAAEKGRIRRVNNCLNVLFSDVADYHLDTAVEKASVRCFSGMG